MAKRVHLFDEDSFRRAVAAFRKVLARPVSGARYRASQPVLSARPGSGGLILRDGCECNNVTNYQGTTLTGSPSICCTGHEVFRIGLGSVLGNVYHLYHSGGDIWSTFHADDTLDNPIVMQCDTYSHDYYDVVMDIAAKTIESVLRDDPADCDEFCFRYRREQLFGCLKSNQFELESFSYEGDTDLEIPLCVCVVPVTSNTDYPTDSGHCVGCSS